MPAITRSQMNNVVVSKVEMNNEAKICINVTQRPRNQILRKTIPRKTIPRNQIQLTQRPKRNIKPVNYAGMDMSDEDEGIVNVYNIKFEEGKLIEKRSNIRLSEINDLDDEDYVFEDEEEEDEDQEDEDDEDQEDEKKYQDQEKENIKIKIHQENNYDNVINRSPIVRRTRNQINYAGMDMNEDDEGEVSVCKRWFENGKVTSKWSKRQLSEVNELDDEDYVPELY